MRTSFLCAIACVVSLGCGPGPTLPEGALDPIPVGVVIPLSGTLGSDGSGWLEAAQVAVLEINAAGGPLPGRTIELVIEDSETNPARGEAIANRLINEDRVVAILGSAASSVTLEVAAVATPAGIPQVSCCSTSDRITQMNEALGENQNYLFRTAPPDLLQAGVVAIAAEDRLCTSLAILHLNDDYGTPFGMAIETLYTARGGTVAVRVPFEDELASYTTEIAMIRDAVPTPDCVALVAFPGSGGTILRDWSSLSGAPEVTWIGTDGVRGPGFIDEVGDPALIDQFYGTSPVTDAPTPEYNSFADRFAAIYGRNPTPFSSSQYDAMAVLGLAIARAGSTDGMAIRDALREVASPPSDRGLVRSGDLSGAIADIREGRDVDYQGGSGSVDFDEFGDVITAYEIWRYDAPPRAPCLTPTILAGDNGSFCRTRIIAAEDLGAL